jgi:hypothetical protein
MRTFKVSDVEPASRGLLPTLDLEHLLAERIRSDLEAAGSHQQSFVHCTGHPVVAAAHLAFAQHLPLALSPDDVWLCIAQGFGAHVNLHAEELRHRFVAHTGKATIGVRRDDFLRGAASNDWPGVVEEFSDRLQAHLGPTGDLVVAAFSTTGNTERTASQIALLGAMQAYFGYEFYTFCGIPSITLLGDVDDWKAIRQRVVALGDFELGHWVRSLTPILDHFVAAAQGQIDLGFWRSFFKTNSESGEGKVTGWINALFPYLDETRTTSTGAEGMGRLFRNPHMDDWQGTDTDSGDVWIRDSQFPSGLSCAPFTWFFHDTKIPMEILGGFVGVSQDPRTLVVSPATGWVIRDKAASPLQK